MPYIKFPPLVRTTIRSITCPTEATTTVLTKTEGSPADLYTRPVVITPTMQMPVVTPTMRFTLASLLLISVTSKVVPPDAKTSTTVYTETLLVPSNA